MADITLGTLLAPKDQRDDETAPIDIVRTLDMIATEIRAFSYTLLSNAVEIGRRMAEAKGKLPHGAFGKWVEENTGYSYSAASNFMRVFRRYGVQSNLQAPVGLSYTNALAMLTLPPAEHERFMSEAHQVDGETKTVVDMTSRELEKAIRERKEALARAEEAAAQSKASEEARAKMEADMKLLSQFKETADGEIARLEQKIKALESTPVDVAVMEVDQAKLDQAREEAVAGMREQLEMAKAAKAKAEEKRKAAEEALAAAVNKLEAAEKAAKRAALAGDKDMAQAQFLFEQGQDIANRMQGILMSLRNRGNEVGAAGVQKAMRALSDAIGRAAE